MSIDESLRSPRSVVASSCYLCDSFIAAARGLRPWEARAGQRLPTARLLLPTGDARWRQAAGGRFHAATLARRACVPRLAAQAAWGAGSCLSPRGCRWRQWRALAARQTRMIRCPLPSPAVARGRRRVWRHLDVAARASCALRRHLLLLRSAAAPTVRARWGRSRAAWRRRGAEPGMPGSRAKRSDNLKPGQAASSNAKNHCCSLP